MFGALGLEEDLVDAVLAAVHAAALAPGRRASIIIRMVIIIMIIITLIIVLIILIIVIIKIIIFITITITIIIIIITGWPFWQPSMLEQPWRSGHDHNTNDNTNDNNMLNNEKKQTRNANIMIATKHGIASAALEERAWPRGRAAPDPGPTQRCHGGRLSDFEGKAQGLRPEGNTNRCSGPPPTCIDMHPQRAAAASHALAESGMNN